MAGFEKATSMISLSNPVSKKFKIKPVTNPAPVSVKVITETDTSDTLITFPTPIKPSARKPRKTDLSKCVKDPLQPVHQKADQVIYLGDTGEGDEMSQSSLQRWEGPGDLVYYVQCPECNKRLKQKSYRSHVNTHLGLKRYKCDLCQDRFTRKNDVFRHRRLIHEKPRDFQCEQCQKYFVTKENLESHIKEQHNSYSCRLCHQEFYKLGEFDNHIKQFHPDREKPNPIQYTIKGLLNNINKSNKPSFKLDKNVRDDKLADIERKGKRRKVHTDSFKSQFLYLGEESSATEGREEEDSESLISPSTGLENQLSRDKILGNIVENQDGTFMVVDCPNNEVNEVPEELHHDNSQDAVQTLINAVQELIQTHEANEKNTDDNTDDDVANDIKPVSNRSGVNLVRHKTENVVKPSKEVLKRDGEVVKISEEVWLNLRKQYPGAEFVVVSDM